MGTPRPTRREFCARTGPALALATLGASLPGCGGGITGPSAPTLPNLDGTVVGGALTVAIDSASPLAAVGGAALVNSSAGSFLVARVGPESFSALSSKCTHFGCVISGFESPTYVCPCHGSRFDTSGAVQKGPARQPLPSYATRFVGGVLTITL